MLSQQCSPTYQAKVGTFAETANVDYHLSFADQGKQTSVFRFPFCSKNGSFLFLLYICSKKTKVAVFCEFHFPYIYSIYICIY
jgi:hypothetical protein